MDRIRAEAEDVPSSPPAAGRGVVVVGYDESSHAAAALTWAAARAQKCGLELRIVYAADPPAPLPWTSGVQPHSSSILLHGASRVARRAAQHVAREHPGLVVRGEGVVGSPPAELVMKSGSAALVVVGRRSHGGPLGGLGSVSFALSAHARCPVVVVQGDTVREVGPGHPLVVGVDGSRASKRALTFAGEMAQDAGADLVVVSAWSSPEREPWMGDLWRNPARAADMVAAEYEAAAVTARDAVAQVKLTHPDLVVVARMPEGRPAQVLLGESGDAGLLVVGSRGHGGFAGLTLGSVTRAILRQAELPVAVVRNGGL